MGMKTLRGIVIVPVKNEKDTLREVLERIKRAASDMDILAVDDGSVDSSSKILEDFKDIFVILHKTPEGYGKSLKDGFRFAVEKDYDIIVTIDADMQHPPELIDRFVERIKNCDVVSGSRYHPSAVRYSDPPPDRERINRIITQRLRSLTGLNITDSFCGFKAYRRSVVERLDITEYSYGMPLQVWIQLWRMKVNLAEIPVPLIYYKVPRFFGDRLDEPDERLDYYLRVIDEEIKR